MTSPPSASPTPTPSTSPVSSAPRTTAPSRSWTTFYRYTMVSLVLSVLVVIPFVQLSTLERVLGAEPDHPGAALALLLVQTLATAIAVYLVVDRERVGGHLRWLPMLATVLPSVAALALVLPAGTGRTEWLWVLGIVVLGVSGPLSALRWWMSVPVTVGAAAVLSLAGVRPAESLPLLAALLAVVLLTRSTLWLLQLVHALEEARTIEAQLALAEERLRFSRDLHDVMGRDLSAIAVSAELVAKLAERGDERTADQARGIARTARSSLAEVRALARGYREADLETELRGTLSLLRSAAVDATVTGDVADVPADHAEAAAWVLREAGTNLLRHARPRHVTIHLGADGVAVTNDGLLAPGADGPLVEGTGLTGLRERLGPGRQLRAERHGDQVTLTVGFPVPANSSPAESSPAEAPSTEPPSPEPLPAESEERP